MDLEDLQAHIEERTQEIVTFDFLDMSALSGGITPQSLADAFIRLSYLASILNLNLNQIVGQRLDTADLSDPDYWKADIST